MCIDALSERNQLCSAEAIKSGQEQFFAVSAQLHFSAGISGYLHSFSYYFYHHLYIATRIIHPEKTKDFVSACLKNNIASIFFYILPNQKSIFVFLHLCHICLTQYF